jgi:hypothetical protein
MYGAGFRSRFREEVAFQVDRIATHPWRFPEIMDGVRRARLRRFPYGPVPLWFVLPTTGGRHLCHRLLSREAGPARLGKPYRAGLIPL